MPHDREPAPPSLTPRGRTPQETPSQEIKAQISAVQEDIVRLRLTDTVKGRLVKNEVVYIRPGPGPR